MTTPTPAPGFEPVELPSKYAKAIVAILTAVLTVFATAMIDNKVTSLELVNVGIAFLTAFGVYALPNFQQGTGAWIKLLVALAGTVLQAVAPFVAEGHVTPAQWLLVAIAGLGALGVGIVPNTPTAKVISIEPAKVTEGDIAA